VRQLFTGWGRTAPTAAEEVAVDDVETVVKALADPSPGGTVARGLGRSYGDPAQNAGGTVLDMTGLSGVRALDADEGVATVAGGTSLEDLMRWLLPLGWFVPVTPGTRFVTVAGAIASDVHGKGHHATGSFGNAVLSMEVVLPGGERRVLTPDGTADAFWATTGGMGLTGTIVEATLRLLPVETSRMVVDTERADDLDDLMGKMEAGDADYRYSAAWLDSLARGKHLGRGVLTRGDHARLDQVPRRQRPQARRFDPRTRIVAPPWAPPGMLNALTVGAFNEAWFRRHPVERRGEVQGITAFFHPLDGVAGWNRAYGPRGMLQYQPVVPFGAEDVVRRIFERAANERLPSLVTVLKRFGPGNAGHLSFPMPGWTLNLDFPVGRPDLHGILDELDELVLAAGGRVYLAKDSRMRPEHLPAMYPRLDEWRAVRSELDPNGALTSDLNRRLRLTG
jgi:decaprenylphospho-beta-D-ribofuranose 2-oxidase